MIPPTALCIHQHLDLRSGALIKTPVSVSCPSPPHNAQWPPPHKIDTFAIWDTAATNTAFDRELVAQLGLKPDDECIVQTGGGLTDSHFHTADVCLYGKPFSGVAVVELDILRRDTPDNRPARVLIGMDIIMEGDFALTLSGNKLELFFRVPSQGLAVPI